MEIKATGLPETIEDYQVALNAAFAGGKAYGLAQRTWVNATTWRGLTDEERQQIVDLSWRQAPSIEAYVIRSMQYAEAKLKEKNT